MSLIFLNTRNKYALSYVTYFLPSDYYNVSTALIFYEVDMYKQFISSVNVRARLLPNRYILHFFIKFIFT